LLFHCATAWFTKAIIHSNILCHFALWQPTLLLIIPNCIVIVALPQQDQAVDFFFFGCLLWKLLRFSTLTNSIRAGTCHCILQLKRLHAARMNHSLPQQDQAADLLFFSSLLWWKLLRASTLTNSIGAAFPQLKKLFQRTNNKPGHWGGCQSLGTAQS